MTGEEARTYLLQHQPMPSDSDITENEADTFIAILQFLEENPNPDFIPLLMGSVSSQTGLGMYEQIQFVLNQFSEGEVVPHVRVLLQSPNPGARSWAVGWALEFPSSTYLKAINEILHSPEDDDSHYLAVAVLERLCIEHQSENAMYMIEAAISLEIGTEARELARKVLEGRSDI